MPPRLSVLLLAVIVAGLFAGSMLAAFHWTLTEPIIEQAITLEEAHHAGEPHEAPVVSRRVQRVGLWIGFLVYGLCASIFFGSAYYITYGALNLGNVVRTSLLLAALAWWSVTLLPSLKYPANPPGVGLPETVETRQKLYVGFLALSLGGLVGMLILRRFLRQRPRTKQWADLVAFPLYFAYVVTLFLAFPSNADPVPLPVELVSVFRLLSLAGLTLFWLVLGTAFGLLAYRAPSMQGPRDAAA
ncbi:MAG TPA: CbtA family protein [Herpetosiphonaceae bacterium]|nr:CbtA family protein [Actinomycetota bacterium]HSH80325.1 CbtA family protein [Herpetosiphonaceae bacterium]